MSHSKNSSTHTVWWWRPKVLRTNLRFFSYLSFSSFLPYPRLILLSYFNDIVIFGKNWKSASIGPSIYLISPIMLWQTTREYPDGYHARSILQTLWCDDALLLKYFHIRIYEAVSAIILLLLQFCLCAHSTTIVDANKHSSKNRIYLIVSSFLHGGWQTIESRIFNFYSLRYWACGK